MLHQYKDKIHHHVADGLSLRQRRIYNFLHTNPIGVLCTVSPDGEPHGTVVYFTIDKDFCSVFLTKSDTRKYKNLQHNNHVMLTVYEPITQTVSQIIGVAEELTDSYDVNGVAGAILGVSLHGGNISLPPISKLRAGTYSAFKIHPVQIKMAVYGQAESGDYDDLFETIESFDLRD